LFFSCEINDIQIEEKKSDDQARKVILEMGFEGEESVGGGGEIVKTVSSKTLLRTSVWIRGNCFGFFAGIDNKDNMLFFWPRHVYV
jgi:hypothetical protein